MDIARYISICAAAAKKSLAEIARLTDQTPSNLNNKLRRNDMRLSDLEKIAAAFGCKLEIKFISEETGKHIIDL